MLFCSLAAATALRGGGEKEMFINVVEGAVVHMVSWTVIRQERFEDIFDQKIILKQMFDELILSSSLMCVK